MFFFVEIMNFWTKTMMQGKDIHVVLVDFGQYNTVWVVMHGFVSCQQTKYTRSFLDVDLSNSALFAFCKFSASYVTKTHEVLFACSQDNLSMNTMYISSFKLGLSI